MIYIGKSPYRISLLGGGTDLDWFVNQYGFGYSVGYSLNQFSYSVINNLPPNSLRGVLNYSTREEYCDVDNIAHSLIREALLITNYNKMIEMSSYGFASGGSGLGGSSSFLISFLAVLKASQGIKNNPYELAQLASEIEINRLGKPIGRQDQFISASGGISAFKFLPNAGVSKLSLSVNTLNVINRVISDLYLIPSSKTRSADNVLASIKEDPETPRNLLEIREITESFLNLDSTDENHIESELHNSIRNTWLIKKKMTNVMDNSLNEQYEKINTIPNNWIRLLGAGSGGYFLLSSKISEEVLKKEFNALGIDNFFKATMSENGIEVTSF